MRIALWPLHYLPMVGGAEVQVHHLAIALQNLGAEVIVIANHPNASYVYDTYEKIPVFRFPFVSALTEGNFKKVKEILAKVTQLLHQFAPDIVHAHALVEQISFYQNRVFKASSFIERSALFQSTSFERKISDISLQDLPSSFSLQPFKATLYVTTHGGLLEAAHCQRKECIRLCEKARFVTAPAENFLKQLFLKPEQLRVIPNGLPRAKAPLSPFPKNPVIGAIGRLAPEKGFDTALYALKLLLPKIPSAKLLLIGDGPELPFLSRCIEELNLGQAVEKIGVIPPSQVHKFIDQAQVVVIPSTHECLNLVALETAMRARPVVASNIFGLKEIVEDQITGFLITPQNPTHLAEKAYELLSNPKLAKQMGERAYKRVSEQFSYEAMIQNYLKLYGL